MFEVQMAFDASEFTVITIAILIGIAIVGSFIGGWISIRVTAGNIPKWTRQSVECERLRIRDSHLSKIKIIRVDVSDPINSNNPPTNTQNRNIILRVIYENSEPETYVFEKAWVTMSDGSAEPLTIGRSQNQGCFLPYIPTNSRPEMTLIHSTHKYASGIYNAVTIETTEGLIRTFDIPNHDLDFGGIR